MSGSSSKRPIKLGPFTLHSIIGQGAMGDVWSGMHRDQKVPVAVKVMGRAGSWEAEHVERFRSEVKAVARLTHPGIVMILDYGEISDVVAANSGGELRPGTPYLAMELAPFGALDRIGAPLEWWALKATLLNLLDALAHAHARGVIHRDIKPANVLITAREDWPASLKLTDFGIAQATDDQGRSGSTERSIGTPNYMAPEQFEGLWREYGPWTDLYSLGCMAYELATGRLPFEADTFVVHAYKHLKTQAPPMELGDRAPAGFEAWLMRLLEKDPRRRFRRAADAAWALVQLGGPDKGEIIAPLDAPGFTMGWLGDGSRTEESDLRGLEPLSWVRDDDKDTTIGNGTGSEGGDGPGTEVQAAAAGQASASDPSRTEAVPLPEGDAPPLSQSWRRSVPPPPSMKLIGAGLGLFGLRAIPLVGRQAERDIIWNTLHATHQEGQAHLLIVQGASGLGKSRLVEWMCERAHELGAATIFSAHHGPILGLGDGLPRMVARHLGCVGLKRAEALRHIERALRRCGVTDPYEWQGLTQIVAPAGPDAVDDGARVEFGAPSEWYSLVRRAVGRASQDRPVIVWLDDVQWGADALGFADHLMSIRTRTPQPILVLMTVRQEALADRPMEGALIARLLRDHPLASALELAPLDAVERAALVEELLGLEGALAHEVEARSQGNPLFAVQLVGDWVQRGVLEVRESGFALKAGEQALLPDDIHEIMDRRLARMLDGLPDVARSALEMGAALGQDFDDLEWRDVCALAGVQPTPALLGAMLNGDLVNATSQGWSFAHGMIRESIERSAHDRGRADRNHLMCARMLQARYSHGARGVAARVGLHYLTAGDLEQALTHLHRAAAEHMAAGEYAQALEVLSRRERGLREMALPKSDPRWGEGGLLRAHVWRRQGRLEESRLLSRDIEREARAHNWSSLLPRALQNTGDVARIQGNMHQAANIYQLAMSLFEHGQDRRGLAEAHFGIADILCQTGDLEGARQTFERVLEIARELGQDDDVAGTLCGLGQVALQRDDLDEALALFHDALQIFQHHGGQRHVADCLKSLADVARFKGQFEAARAGYERALQFHEASGSGDAVHTRLALGLLHLHRGEHAQAAAIIEACRQIFVDTQERDDVGRAHAMLLPCTAASGDWAAFDRHREAAEALLGETARFDRDVAWPAQLAGTLAAAHNQPERARLALELAQVQWILSRHHARAAEVSEALARLPSNLEAP